MEAQVKELKAAFPSTLSSGRVLHTLAVKANPLSKTIQKARQLGLGAECASIAEVSQALRNGIHPQDVIYDSPAKTLGEIRHALGLGVLINLDNSSEIQKARDALETLKKEGKSPENPRIGIRINPQMEPGTIAVTSTSTKTSKFGIATEDMDSVIELYKAHPFLNALHVHTGSQGCPMELSARGIARAVSIARKVNNGAKKQIEHLDIGGGVPADYGSDGKTGGGELFRFEDYRKAIDQFAPGIWDEGFSIYTEMGRSLTSKMGWTASRVEAVKESGGRRIAICHVGADLFVRTAYQPQNWPHRISVFSSEGNPKEAPFLHQDIAGPLCFSGDLIATKRSLPRIDEGDIIVVHDTGAYTYSMFSRYNSRLAPSVYGYYGLEGHEDISFELVKAAETVEQVVKFWD
ncbi:hypothetical protein AAMO2058_001344100 [Amorphochlora amoebiformis]